MRPRDIDIEGVCFAHSMRFLRVLAVAMLLTGASILAYAILTGQMEFALAFFFIPVIYGSSLLGGAAIGLIVLGIFVYMADLFVQSGSAEEGSMEPGPWQNDGARPKKEFGGVVLVGPIPIVFGSSNKAALYAVITAVVVLIVLTLALFFL